MIDRSEKPWNKLAFGAVVEVENLVLMRGMSIIRSQGWKSNEGS